MQQRKKYIERLSKFRKSPKVKVIAASEHEVATAYHFLELHSNIPASLADWVSLVVAVKREIPVIQTFDRDFNEIIHRVCLQTGQDMETLT